MKKFNLHRIIICLYDFSVIPISWILAYWFRDNFEPIGDIHLTQMYQTLPIVFITQALSLWYFSLYRGVWKFSSVADLMRILRSVIFGVVVAIVILFMLTKLQSVPRSIFPLYTLLLITFLGGGRIASRILTEYRFDKSNLKRLLIIGAGFAGENLVRDIIKSKANYNPLVFIDDDISKRGQEIHSIRIIGGIEKLAETVKRLNIDIIFIALPSATSPEMRKVVSACEKTGVIFRTLPSIHDLADGRVNIEALRSVAIEDLMGRDTVSFDREMVNPLVKDRVVMVTGGGGSIGSELCMQIATCQPKQLIILDNSEFNLYSIEQALQTKFPKVAMSFLLVSVVSESEINSLLQKYRPDFVFHSAAYKHVPLLENNSYSAFTNNLLGTYVMAKCAARHNVKKFILISTDKAVNPINVMGATKRIAEITCQYFQAQSETKFIIVRFGNVLESTGSVLPLFKEQIRQGGPLTVTHKEIERYFMTIEEASSLILKSALIGSGGEIFVLDMGEPVKIRYLAEQMIKLSGRTPYHDIDINFIGLRPGEKLTEQLFYETEKLKSTEENKIFQAQTYPLDYKKIDLLLSKRNEINNNDSKVRSYINEFIPGFHNEKLENHGVV